MDSSVELEIAKLLSVGTVLYKNTEAQLLQFATSLKLSARGLFDETGIRTRLFVIENSDLRARSLLEEELANQVAVNYLPGAGNIGFGAGMNRLMKVAFQSSNRFLLANPDGAFHRNCLSHLVKKSLDNPHGIIEARQFPEELSKVFDITSGLTSWASGACLLITKEIFEKTAGFDERFFLYMEDVDFSWRVRGNGYEIYTCSDALFSHSLIGRSNEANDQTLKHVLRSGILLGRKWGNATFSERCAERLKLLSPLADPLDTVADGKCKIADPRWEAPAVVDFAPDFEHSFAFSEIRWH